MRLGEQEQRAFLAMRMCMLWWSCSSVTLWAGALKTRFSYSYLELERQVKRATADDSENFSIPHFHEITQVRLRHHAPHHSGWHLGRVVTLHGDELWCVPRPQKVVEGTRMGRVGPPPPQSARW